MCEIRALDVAGGVAMGISDTITFNIAIRPLIARAIAFTSENSTCSSVHPSHPSAYSVTS